MCEVLHDPAAEHGGVLILCQALEALVSHQQCLLIRRALDLLSI